MESLSGKAFQRRHSDKHNCRPRSRGRNGREYVTHHAPLEASHRAFFCAGFRGSEDGDKDRRFRTPTPKHVPRLGNARKSVARRMRMTDGDDEDQSRARWNARSLEPSRLTLKPGELCHCVSAGHSLTQLIMQSADPRYGSAALITDVSCACHSSPLPNSTAMAWLAELDRLLRTPRPVVPQEGEGLGAGGVRKGHREVPSSHGAAHAQWKRTSPARKSSRHTAHSACSAASHRGRLHLISRRITPFFEYTSRCTPDIADFDDADAEADELSPRSSAPPAPTPWSRGGLLSFMLPASYLLMAASLLLLSFWSSRSLASRALLSSVHSCIISITPLRCSAGAGEASGRVPCVPGGVQAERWSPRAATHLRARRCPALPEPPPPRALHAREHPGHDDHSQLAPPLSCPNETIEDAGHPIDPTAHLTAGAFPGGGSSRGSGSQAGAGHFRQPPRVGHVVVGFAPSGMGGEAMGKEEAVLVAGAAVLTGNYLATAWDAGVGRMDDESTTEWGRIDGEEIHCPENYWGRIGSSDVIVT
nr:unnamed protein product [Digitaria exilis]